MDVLSSALHDLVSDVAAAPDLAAEVRRRHLRHRRTRRAGTAVALALVAAAAALPLLLPHGAATARVVPATSPPSRPVVDGVEIGHVPAGWRAVREVDLSQSPTYGRRTAASLVLTRRGGTSSDYFAVTVVRSGATDLRAFAAQTRSGGRRAEELQVHGFPAVLALPGPATRSSVVRLLWVEHGVTLSVASPRGLPSRGEVLAVAAGLRVGDVLGPADPAAARAAVVAAAPRAVDGVLFDSPRTALLLLAADADGRPGQATAELVAGRWLVLVRPAPR